MRPLTIADLEDDLRVAIDCDDETLIASLGRQIDDLERLHPRSATCLEAALFYAEQGLRTFALQPGQKIPHPHTSGCKDATSDPDLIRAWWDRWPGSNVAIATGHLVDVVDIDGPVGIGSYARRILDDVGLPTGPAVVGVVCTPRPGGKHLYIPAAPGHGNRTSMLPGIDHRGAGGYVVAPPSTTVQGQYVWTRPLDLSSVSC